MSNRKIYRLHDKAILGIVRALQQGLLMGTDIADHFRMMKFETMRDDDETLVLTDEYLANESENFTRLIEKAHEIRQHVENIMPENSTDDNN